MSNHGKVALITGSSRGIGAAVAQRLAADGFRIVVNYAVNEAPAMAVAAKIMSMGGEAITVRANIADPANVTAMFDATERAFGGVDVVVNNAGIMRLARITETSDEVFDHMISVNLKGTFNVLRQAGKRVREGGRIINMSTSVIGMRLPTYGAYIATKAAVEGLAQVLSQEMRGRNITVNAVAPGPTATELFLDGKSAELIERMSKMNPLERLGQPQDIAQIVAFLACPQGAWINGQTLRANGGMC